MSSYLTPQIPPDTITGDTFTSQSFPSIFLEAGYIRLGLREEMNSAIPLPKLPFK